MLNLILKTFRDKRFFLLAWAVGLLLLGYSITILYPTFSGTLLDEMTKDIPAAMQGFIGDINGLKQLDVFIGTQVYEVNLSIFIFALTILLAISLTVSEEAKGQLRTLLALPIGRRKIILAKWFAIVDISLIISVAVTAGVYVGLLQIGEMMSAEVLLSLTLMLWLLTTTMATIVFAVGAASGSFALTITIGSVIAGVSYLMTTFSQGVEWLKPYEWISILHYFPATEVAEGTLALQNIAVYLGLIAVSLTIALVQFPRRDIKS